MLDRDCPLWRVYVIDRPSAGTTLLYRVHHAIGDGFALLGILLSMCEGGDEGARARVPASPKRRRVATALGCTTSLARIVALPPDPKTHLKGPLGREKRVAWSEPLALADVKSTAHSASATVNDVLVATAAGALGRYLARRGADARRPRDPRDGPRRSARRRSAHGPRQSLRPGRARHAGRHPRSARPGSRP